MCFRLRVNAPLRGIKRLAVTAPCAVSPAFLAWAGVLHPIHLVTLGDFGIIGVVFPETLPIDAIEYGAAVATLVGAHLESIDVPVFAAQVGTPAVKASEVIGTFVLIENLIAMISAFGSGNLHHFLIHRMMTMLGVMPFFWIFHCSSLI